jgi:hypothetical protein
MSDLESTRRRLARARTLHLQGGQKRDEGMGVAELRELLSAFIDAASLPGHVVTDAQWERACLLCGRYGARQP